MENKISKKGPVFLPVYFKKVGFAIIILAFIPVIIIKSLNIEMVQTQKELFRVLTENAFILGLLFVAWSKDKVEDEITVAIRLKSITWAFTWAVFYVILGPIGSLLFKYPIANLTGQEVVVSMLFVYLLIYYLQKRGRFSL